MEQLPQKRQRDSKSSKRNKGRKWTVSIAIPDSIINNAQSQELKAYLVSQISRSAAIFNIDEIVIFQDNKTQRTSNQKHEALGFFTRNLQYLETPQYLRKTLFPRHPDLKFSGLMNPLDTPHHLRKQDVFQYREGVTVSRPSKLNQGSWVNIGLAKDCQIDMKIDPGTRVTVKLEEFQSKKKFAGQIVSPQEVVEETGVYWGYQTRIAENFVDVFDQCPYEGGYDLKIGTSDKGKTLKFSKFPRFNHCIIIFGGLDGLEDILQSDENLEDDNPENYFDYYVNVWKNQGTRTIRTEEAVLISLSRMVPYLSKLGLD